MDGVKQTVAVVSGAVSQDHSESLLVSAEQELKKSLLLKSSGDVLSSETVVEGNNPSTNGVDSELMNSQFVIEETNFICETKANLESVQPNEVQAENQTLHENLCDNLNSNEKAECEEPKDNLEELTIGLKKDNVENKEHIIDSQNLSREQASSLIAQNIGVMVNVKNNSLPVEVSECQKNTEISELVNSDTTEKNVQDLNENNCTSENNVTSFNFNKDIQRVGNSEDDKVITNKENLLEKTEINESDINRNNEAQQETNTGLDEQPTINPSGPLPVTSDTSADTINFQDDKKHESESHSVEETTPEEDKETKEFQDKVMCVQECSDNKISLNISNACLEKENTDNSDDKVDNVNEKLMENNDLEQISFSENKVQICETVDKSSLVQNEEEVKNALEDEKVMPEVLNVTPVSNVIIEETCLNEKEDEKETEMEVDVEIDKKCEETELQLKESSTVDDKSKEMDIDYSADFLNINTEISQNSNSDSQNMEIETQKGFLTEGNKIVRHLSSSEEETITGDTTQQEEEDKKILNKKNENICIIPDEVTLKTPVSAQTRRSRGSIEKKQIENSENSDLALSKIKTPNSEKSKSKLRYKRNLGIDNSKTRPVRSAAKLAGNKIKSLVQNDLAYDELVSSAGEEQEIQENTDGSNKMCSQCKEVKVCRFLMVQGDDTHYFCSESCSGTFMKGSQTYGDTCELEISSGEFVRKCAQCHSQVTIDDKCLFWETMDFCNEDCLGKYQTELGSSCANCKGSVVSSSLGKYCVRFGYEVKQFCSSTCLEEYKKGLKVCSYCQKDISTGTEGFLAPVGDKGQFKDFCTQSCMEKYERMSNNVPPPDVSAECAVCSNNKPVQIEVELDHKTHKLCSEPCFAAFKFVNNIKEGQCDMCRKYFDRVKAGNFFLFFDETPRSFCSKTCMNVYILANRKIVPCNWCKVKKYNFDMIKKVSATGQLSMMCSLNCLMLYQVSVNAVCSRRIKCDFCLSIEQAQYHLTMSDATIRNFCSYNCVISFQNRYPKQPIDLIPGAEQLNSPIPTGTPKRIVPRRSQVESSCGPVISSVQSLATTNGPASPSGRVSKNRADVNIVPQVTPATQSIAIPTAVAPLSAPSPQIYQQIITKPAPVKQMKNKSVLCKPYSHTKGVSCRPHPCMKETQTDESLNRKFLIPIPVPIYVPTPMHMFATPFPVPVPFPLPVPVPIFIPTTRNSAKGIFKEIKRIQEKIPTDPFEAELLMMAEMVAGEKKQDPTDSESEDGNEGDDGGDGTFIPENVDTSNTFGDDMLQMALKMASELEEPAVDMESVLTSNTITTSSQPAVDPNKALYASDPDDPDQVHVMAMNRGRKRSVRGSRNSAGATPSKRGRRTSGSVDVPLLPPPEPVPPPRIEVEKPDANMCLKYTFGVNAWRHWVMQKNAELEKAAMTNRKIKLFKPELLQLTADELNFSLCLFVKEVRKPNGTEYAPDTIYYLCLGIQQYLFENGRIDNIFTDSYYEKFTDCLDEVAKKFAALYNDSQYIVTRVEEEHLWESKQLGAHSPHVLLSTLMFFNTKHFNLVTVEEHMQLSFSHIMKHWKRNPNTPGVAKVPGSRNVLLRFYPPQSALEANSRKKKVYEQQENEENPLRCPVKLYEFYLSKCPESVKTRNDVFYLLPERSCVPDSPVWYSTMALGKEPLMKMLHRVKMVKEINIALLTC